VRRIPAVPKMSWVMLRHPLRATTIDNFPPLRRAGPQSARPGVETSRANNNKTNRAAPLFAHFIVKIISRRLHDIIATTTSRPAHPQLSLSPNTTTLLVIFSSHNTMFKIGPPSSSDDSAPSSRDVSPSKGSEWSTTSEPHIDPKTPQKRRKSISSSEADWSDDSDTPVRPRTSRRQGHIYTRDFAASDERSLLTFDDASFLSSSDSRSDSETDSEFQLVRPRPEHTESTPENELPFKFANPETWETQHDTRGIDPLMLGEVEVPVRPLPPVSYS
jgi:hypothetical protein